MIGIKSENLVAIVDFLNYGVANISHDNLDSFLNIAEVLELKGRTMKNYRTELDCLYR